jgi:hypothetical protein
MKQLTPTPTIFMKSSRALLLLGLLAMMVVDCDGQAAPEQADGRVLSKEDPDEDPNWHKTGTPAPPPGTQSVGSFKTPTLDSEESDSAVLPKHMHCDGALLFPPSLPWVHDWNLTRFARSLPGGHVSDGRHLLGHDEKAWQHVSPPTVAARPNTEYSSQVRN